MSRRAAGRPRGERRACMYRTVGYSIYLIDLIDLFDLFNLFNQFIQFTRFYLIYYSRKRFIKVEKIFILFIAIEKILIRSINVAKLKINSFATWCKLASSRGDRG